MSKNKHRKKLTPSQIQALRLQILLAEAKQLRQQEEKLIKQQEDLTPTELKHWKAVAENEYDKLWNGKSSKWMN